MAIAVVHNPVGDDLKLYPSSEEATIQPSLACEAFLVADHVTTTAMRIMRVGNFYRTHLTLLHDKITPSQAGYLAASCN